MSKADAAETLMRARLMARIAAPLMTASIRHQDASARTPETMAESFAADINRVVPLAQILVEALKPQNDAEHATINALTAPVAAKLVAQNSELLALDDAEEFTRLLKPSLNVLASFCDRDSAAAQPDEPQSALTRGLVAMTPIIGCLSYYAFGKSPAKRLTDTLDVYMRAQGDLLASLPAAMRRDPDLHVALQDAAASLFAALFDKMMLENDGGTDDPNALFKNLLAQWTQGLSLLGVLLTHSVLDEASESPSTKAPKQSKIRALRAKAVIEDDESDDEDGDVQGSGGSGARGQKPDNYNPMSFFAKRGA